MDIITDIIMDIMDMDIMYMDIIIKNIEQFKIDSY